MPTLEEDFVAESPSKSNSLDADFKPDALEADFKPEPRADGEPGIIARGQSRLGEAMARNQLPQRGVPAVTVPRFGEEGTAKRGVSEALSGLIEGATTPEGIAAAGLLPVPGVGKLIAGGMIAAGTKAAAELAGEASVTKDPQKIAEAATIGAVTALPFIHQAIKTGRAEYLLGGASRETPVAPEEVARTATLPPKPALLPESQAELNKLPGGPDAVQERGPTPVPVEEPPRSSPTVGEGVPQAEAPALPQVEREQQPQPAAAEVSPVRDVAPPETLPTEPAAEGGAETTAAPTTEPTPAGQVEPAGAAVPTVEPQQEFSKAVQDVPVKSQTLSDIKDQAEQDQNLGITALPKIGGTGLAKVGNALKAVVSEIRDIPKFTPFKEAINRWFGENQKTSLEVRSLQKDIESRVPSEVRREAITNYLQADGDVAKLDAWARATTNKARKVAYDAAKTLTPDELKVAQAIRKLYDDYLVKAQSHDLVKGGIEDYVTQVWKKPLLGSAQFAQFAAKLSPTFKFGKQRTFENFFEGEQLGYKPVTKDISKLVGLYASEMGKTIATRDFIEDLTTKTAADGRPLATPAGVGTVVTDATGQPKTLIRPAVSAKATGDYSKWTHPALQEWKWVAKDPISGGDVILKGNLQLHPDIAGHVENVLSRSAIKRWYEKPSTPLGVLPKAIVQGIDKWQNVSKQIMLGFFAPFHHVQEGTHAIGHRVNPLFDLPKLDSADPAIQRAMDHGLALAGDNAAMANFREGVGAQKIFDKIPVLGKWANDWSDFLFHEYIPKLKLKTYNAILERNKGVYSKELASGSVSLDDVEYLSGKQANAAFGHLNYADIGRDPTVQHILGTLLLAPDFLEARGRFTAQAMKGLVGKEGREQLLAIGTLAATFYVGARIANKLGDDNYHFEEPFGVIHGNRLYTMRSVPEDIWRAFKDTRRFIYGRASPIVTRGAIEYLTGKNYRGEKTSAAETTQDLLVSWIPITMRNLPGIEKLSPSQANRSISAWESFIGALGVQISRHSPISKTYGLAADYMKSKGIKEDRGSYPVSKYQQLRYALEDADVEKAATEIKRLTTEEKKNWGKVTSGFRESIFHPFTKTKLMDRQFRDSLAKDDREMFDEATEQRKRVWSRFIQARSQAQNKAP